MTGWLTDCLTVYVHPTSSSLAGTHWADWLLARRSLDGRPSAVLADPFMAPNTLDGPATTRAICYPLDPRYLSARRAFSSGSGDGNAKSGPDESECAGCIFHLTRCVGPHAAWPKRMPVGVCQPEFQLGRHNATMPWVRNDPLVREKVLGC